MSVVCRIVLTAAVLFAPTPVLAGTWRHNLVDEDFRAHAEPYDSVGLLLGKTHLCSATLIEEDWLVTAAHCLDRGKASHYTFELGPMVALGSEKYVHPNWTGQVSGGSDIALLRLDQPLASAPTAERATSISLGETITSVGFGRGGDGVTGAVMSAGVKRAGDNVIEADGSAFNWSSTILLNDFDHPTDGGDPLFTAPVEQYEFNIASGDSGGGMFKMNGQLAGVTSLGWATDGNVNSDYGDGGGFTNLVMFNSWIDDILAGGSGDGGGGEKEKGGPPANKGKPFGLAGVTAMTLTRPVPEPSTAALMIAAGLLTLAAGRCRRGR